MIYVLQSHIYLYFAVLYVLRVYLIRLLCSSLCIYIYMTMCVCVHGSGLFM